MSSAARALIPHSQFEQLREARTVLRTEGEAVLALADRLDGGFCRACDLLLQCSGSAVVTGMGKAGLIGRKIAATLSSTGTRARYLHPADAVHGDVGCVDDRDVVLALSNSGETEEITRLIPILRQFGVPIVAVTAGEESTLGRAASVVIPLGRLDEAGPHGLAPTTSTTAMLAVGDALALVVSRQKGFTPRQFAVFHPAGSLGARLRRVEEVMRCNDELRVAREHETVREVFVVAGKPGRRTGAVMLVGDDGALSGLFTDSDLARLLEHRQDESLDRPIAEVMTRNPLTVTPGLLVHEAIELICSRKISEIPVVDEDRRPIGLIDITDVIGFVPHDAETNGAENREAKPAD